MKKKQTTLTELIKEETSLASNLKDALGMELVLTYFDMWVEYNIAPDLGLEDMSAEILTEFMNWIINDLACSPKTIEGTIRILTRTFQYAYAEGFIKENIAQAIA